MFHPDTDGILRKARSLISKNSSTNNVIKRARISYDNNSRKNAFKIPNSGRFFCKDCQQRFPNYSLAKHLLDHLAATSNVAIDYDSITSFDSNDFLSLTYGNCPFCDFTSSVKNPLDNHLISCHRQVFCPFCLQQTGIHEYLLNDTTRDFEWKQRNLNAEIEQLWCHLQKHLLIKNRFQCKACSLCFLSLDELQIHENCHNNFQKDIKNWNPKGREKPSKNDHWLIYRSSMENKRKQKTNSQDFGKILETMLSTNHFIMLNIHLKLLAVDSRHFNSKTSILHVELEQFKETLDKIHNQNPNQLDYLNILNAKLMKNYTKFNCLCCEENIFDLNHYSLIPLKCQDVCCFETYCFKEQLLHKLLIMGLKEDFTYYINLSKFLIEPDRRLVTEEKIEKAKLFDPNYNVDEEMDEIKKEFFDDPEPYFIHVCLICGIYFKTAKAAAYHIFHHDNDRRSDLGLVHSCYQGHIIYRRCLIRTFRHQNKEDIIATDRILKKVAQTVKMEFLKTYHMGLINKKTGPHCKTKSPQKSLPQLYAPEIDDDDDDEED